jgi:Lipocalin-like domain
MKTINSMLIIAVLAIITGSVGCKKEEVVATIDTKAILTSGKWKLTAQTTDGKDSYSSIDACDKDNTETYSTDGKVTVDQGAVKCDATDPQVQVYTYALSADNKIINIKGGPFDLNFTILEINATTIKYESKDFNSIYTYTKQ